MEWYVCKYVSTGQMVILPDFYVNELFIARHFCEISIMKCFKGSREALDYLMGMVLAEKLIDETLCKNETE